MVHSLLGRQLMISLVTGSRRITCPPKKPKSLAPDKFYKGESGFLIRLSGLEPSPWSTHQFIRHAERSGQRRNSSVAQAVVLSAWQVVHGFGILYLSVIAGVINANVCERTLTSAMVVAIFGIWQAMQLLPADPFL